MDSTESDKEGLLSTPAAEHRLGWGVFVALFVAALLPRVAGANWGGIHPDENINASVKLLAGQWIPDAHYYPPLSNVLNAVAFAVMFVLGRLGGAWAGVAEFRAQYFTDPTPFQVAGRVVCATIGAFAAPLTGMLAVRLGAKRLGAILAGLLVALLPVNVLLSHISKSADVGMATSFVLVAVCFVDFIRNPGHWRRSAALGAAMALAVSFKHSAVFFVAPVFLGAIVLAWPALGRSTAQLVRAAAIAGGAGAMLWLALNVPILADLKNFLRFQEVQKQMSSRPGPVIDVVRTTAPFLAATFTGATLPVVLAFFALPLLRRNRALIVLWACCLIGIAVVMKLTGLRPTVGLYLPYGTLMTALVGVTFAWWISDARPPARAAGLAGWAICAAFLAIGCVTVVRQAVAAPAVTEVARVIRTTMSADVKVLATRPEHAGLPVSAEGRAGERARHERLAAKYKVKLPKEAQERNANAPGGYHVRRMPWVIGGLEVYDEKDVKVVTPFAWPLQKEEYNLDFWIDQGFTAFVLTDEEAKLTSKVAAYVQLYQQIRERCELVTEVKARKPLFWEGDTKIYRLKGQQGGSRPTTVPSDRG